MGGIVSGGLEMWSSAEGATEEKQAAALQLRRERQQADFAINSAMQKGAFESGRQRLMTSSLTAQQKTAYAQSGVDPTSGTAASVQADTAALGEKDAQQLAINAATEAWGYKVGKQQAVENAGLQSRSIDRKGIAGSLGGLSKYASGWLSLGGGGG